MTAPDDEPPTPRRRDDVPEGFDPLGVPREGSERDTFVMLLAVVVALFGLIMTLGWIVLHRLNG